MPKTSLELESLILHEAETIAIEILESRGLPVTSGAIEKLLTLKPELFDLGRKRVSVRESLFSSAVRAVGIDESQSSFRRVLDFSDLI